MQMAEAFRIAQLIGKKLGDNLTTQEKEELETWVNESPRNLQYINNRLQPEVISNQLRTVWEMDDKAIRRKLTILRRRNETSLSAYRVRRTGKVYSLLKISAVAAAGLTGLTILLLQIFRQPPAGFSSHRSEGMSNLRGSRRKDHQKPELILSNGSVVYPDSIPEGRLAQEGVWSIVKEGSHHIAYLRTGSAVTSYKEVSSPYNVISVPGKDSFEVSLPSGSRVRLSPGSSLSFPLYPLGDKAKQRVLALSGESLFDVAPNDSVPFIVEARWGEMTVLGTVFSVRAYDKEDTLGITLFTGKLAVSNGKIRKTMDTSERAIIDSTSSNIRIVSRAMIPPGPIWKPEAFDFTDRNIPSAVREIAKWYGMKPPVFLKGVDTVTIGKMGRGPVSKDIDLATLLHMFETTGLHFKIDKQTIIVQL